MSPTDVIWLFPFLTKLFPLRPFIDALVVLATLVKANDRQFR